MAIVGLITLGIPMLLITIWVKVEMGSPICFVQCRVGKGGRLFRCHKFRTMVTDNSKGTISMRGDDRITALGRTLREWKLDELPELVDVLMGRMSFVGPRPDVPGYADKLTGDDRDVLKMLPGITGPATLKYRDEEQLIADYVWTMLEAGDERSAQEIARSYNDRVIYPDKVRLNCYYYRNYRLRDDLKMIISTVFNRRMWYAEETI